jgi:hypothetical protein
MFMSVMGDDDDEEEEEEGLEDEEKEGEHGGAAGQGSLAAALKASSCALVLAELPGRCCVAAVLGCRAPAAGAAAHLEPCWNPPRDTASIHHNP